MSRPLPGHDGQLSIGIHPYIVIRSGQWKDPIQVIPLHPILQLAGLVSSIRADFKHGHHNDLDRDWSGGRPGRSLRGGNQRHKE